jgi:hypothetical protein
MTCSLQRFVFLSRHIEDISSHILGEPLSSVVGPPLVQVLDDPLLSISACYDNVWGDATRLARYPG